MERDVLITETKEAREYKMKPMIKKNLLCCRGRILGGIVIPSPLKRKLTQRINLMVSPELGQVGLYII